MDLTFVSLKRTGAGAELDMGTSFDFFGPQSWSDCVQMTPQQRANRLLLQTVMKRHGFRPYAKEWWHFTLEGERSPDTFFDIPVE